MFSVDQILAFVGVALAVIAIIIGAGITVAMDAKTRGEFRFAAGCFVFSAIMLLCSIGVWDVGTTLGFGKRAGISLLAVSIVVVGAFEAVRWTQARHTQASGPAPKATETPSSKQDISSRISSLIAEALGLQNTCQQVPNPYSTPAQHRPDLANAIVNWKQRAESVLAFDTDPRPLQMWKDAVLHASPEVHHTIAIYCTELNVKVAVLNRILTRKSLTTQERIGQLGMFISRGNSIKQSCLVPSATVPNMDEIQWTTTVMQWLGDNFDEHHAQAFNHALHPASGSMPGTHPPEIVALWDRTQARIDVLSEIKAGLLQQ